MQLFTFPWFPAVVVDPAAEAGDVPEGFCPSDKVLEAKPEVDDPSQLKLVRFFDKRGSWYVS